MLCSDITASFNFSSAFRVFNSLITRNNFPLGINLTASEGSSPVPRRRFKGLPQQALSPLANKNEPSLTSDGFLCLPLLLSSGKAHARFSCFDLSRHLFLLILKAPSTAKGRIHSCPLCCSFREDTPCGLHCDYGSFEHHRKDNFYVISVKLNNIAGERFFFLVGDYYDLL